MVLEDGLMGRDLGLVVHGNRMVSATCFGKLPLARFGDPAFDYTSNVTQTNLLVAVRHAYAKLKTAVDTSFPNAIIPTLFKNQTKCTGLYKQTE